MKRIVYGSICLMVMLTGLLAVCGGVCAAGAKEYDGNGCLPLITEPGAVAQPLIYCTGDRDLQDDEIIWAQGRDGQGASLSGEKQYFRMDRDLMPRTAITLSLWIDWKGAEDPMSAVGQRIFSMRGSDRGRQNIWLSPCEALTDGSHGLCLTVTCNGRTTRLEKPAGADTSTALLPGWHCLTMVWEQQTIRLYTDGVLWAEQDVGASYGQLNVRQFCLGKGVLAQDEGYLTAVLDDVMLFDRALTAEEIAELAKEKEPSGDGDEPYIPEQTTTVPSTATTAAEPTEAPEENTLPTIPPVVYIVSGIALAAVAALCVAVNVAVMREKGGGR